MDSVRERRIQEKSDGACDSMLVRGVGTTDMRSASRSRRSLRRRRRKKVSPTIRVISMIAPTSPPAIALLSTDEPWDVLDEDEPLDDAP